MDTAILPETLNLSFFHFKKKEMEVASSTSQIYTKKTGMSYNAEQKSNQECERNYSWNTQNLSFQSIQSFDRINNPTNNKQELFSCSHIIYNHLIFIVIVILFIVNKLRTFQD